MPLSAAPARTLWIAETLVGTIQGPGAGTPTMFIRTSGCNLNRAIKKKLFSGYPDTLQVARACLLPEPQENRHGRYPDYH